MPPARKPESERRQRVLFCVWNTDIDVATSLRWGQLWHEDAPEVKRYPEAFTWDLEQYALGAPAPKDAEPATVATATE